MTGRAAPLALVLLALVATDASAARVRSVGDRISFVAAPGERNDLSVSYTEDFDLVFRDRGAPIAAGAGCRRLARGAVRCAYAYDTVVRTRDGDDRVTDPDGLISSVEGGGGDDRLRARTTDGGRGDDILRAVGTDASLTGGPGRDKLIGSPYADRFVDGETDGQAARDVFRGRGGRYVLTGAVDLVSYAARRRPVAVGLGRPLAGQEDVLRRIDGVETGRGADRVVGSDTPNTIVGGPGDDAITGGGGADRLIGGPGADTLDGGDGPDALQAGADADALEGGADADDLDGGGGRDTLAGGAGEDRLVDRDDDAFDGGPDDDYLDARGGAATLACGAGLDALATDPRATVARDCERLALVDPDALPAFNRSDLYGVSVRVVPVVAGDTATFSLSCSFACSGQLTVLAGDTILGRSAYRVDDEDEYPVPVALTAGGGATVTTGAVSVVVTPAEPADLRTAGYRLAPPARR